MEEYNINEPVMVEWIAEEYEEEKLQVYIGFASITYVHAN